MCHPALQQYCCHIHPYNMTHVCMCPVQHHSVSWFARARRQFPSMTSYSHCSLRRLPRTTGNHARGRSTLHTCTTDCCTTFYLESSRVRSRYEKRPNGCVRGSNQATTADRERKRLRDRDQRRRCCKGEGQDHCGSCARELCSVCAAVAVLSAYHPGQTPRASEDLPLDYPGS